MTIHLMKPSSRAIRLKYLQQEIEWADVRVQKLREERDALEHSCPHVLDDGSPAVDMSLFPYQRLCSICSKIT